MCNSRWYGGLQQWQFTLNFDIKNYEMSPYVVEPNHVAFDYLVKLLSLRSYLSKISTYNSHFNSHLNSHLLSSEGHFLKWNLANA